MWEVVQVPFRSKAQMRKIAAMERAGELPPGTFDRWMRKTKNPKQLPERKSDGRSQRGRGKR
jgi:hypothetical protein